MNVLVPHASRGYSLWKRFHDAEKYDMAIKDYTRTVGLRPRHTATYYNLACAYVLMNDIMKRVGSLKKSIDNGFNEWSHINQTTVLIMSGIQFVI